MSKLVGVYLMIQWNNRENKKNDVVLSCVSLVHYVVFHHRCARCVGRVKRGERASGIFAFNSLLASKLLLLLAPSLSKILFQIFIGSLLLLG